MRDTQTRRNRGSWRFARRIVLSVTGVLLLVVGIAALVLPGPGLLIIFAGVAVLSIEFEWAEKRVDYVRGKAMDAAEYSVATWPRIIASGIGAAWVTGAGVVWIINPTIPEFWIFGPKLPFNGTGTGIGLLVSGLVAFLLLGYSYWRFHGRHPSDSI
ncbi:MAG: PGPGW domain-containing protein [Nocardioidaceae bacterium]